MTNSHRVSKLYHPAFIKNKQFDINKNKFSSAWKSSTNRQINTEEHTDMNFVEEPQGMKKTSKHLCNISINMLP